MERPDLAATVHRGLPALLVPLVIGGGFVASRGGSAERFWGIGFALVVLVVGAVVVAVGVRVGVRDALRDRREAQRRRSTATTLPSTVASSPGIGSKSTL